jgi:hypothetical protein
LPEDLACDAATKALAERYIAAAAGDPVLAVLLACEDIAVLRDCASHGMRHGRKLIVEEVQVRSPKGFQDWGGDRSG